jgi:Protein of unknown function (DUF3467)
MRKIEGREVRAWRQSTSGFVELLHSHENISRMRRLRTKASMEPKEEVNMAEKPSEATAPPLVISGDDAVQTPAVLWDDSRMVTHFANVVNIQSTLEQVDLFFGTNKTWNAANERQVKVELTDRVILGPFAAKRLWMALGNVLKEYETRYGGLKLDSR